MGQLKGLLWEREYNILKKPGWLEFHTTIQSFTYVSCALVMLCSLLSNIKAGFCIMDILAQPVCRRGADKVTLSGLPSATPIQTVVYIYPWSLGKALVDVSKRSMHEYRRYRVPLCSLSMPAHTGQLWQLVLFSRHVLLHKKEIERPPTRKLLLEFLNTPLYWNPR